MGRNERFEEWLSRTYKTVLTLLVAAEGRISERTVRGWKKGTTDPSVENLLELHRLGLNVQWYLFGEGEMYSETENGRRWASSGVVREPGQKPSAPEPADRMPELIERIRDVLKEFE